MELKDRELIKVGMYIRVNDTFNEKPAYIVKVVRDVDFGVYLTDDDRVVDIRYIYKYGDILDVLDTGDYVNGRKVYQVGYNFQDDFVLKMSESNYEDFIYSNQIETIVTKEQFESMSYNL